MSQTPTVSADLRSFFLHELANEASMRAEARRKGADDMDETTEAFVPEAHLASARESWEQAPEDIAVEFLGLTPALTPEAREARLAAAEEDMGALVEHYGDGYSLRSLLWPSA